MIDKCVAGYILSICAEGVVADCKGRCQKSAMGEKHPAVE